MTGSVEQRIFTALKNLIGLRKQTTAFADLDNHQLLELDTQNLLVFMRVDPANSRNKVMVVANFNGASQTLSTDALISNGFVRPAAMKDLCTGERIKVVNGEIRVSPLTCLWLID